MTPATAGLALVTGASSGIGEATARALARTGHAVILVARDGARLEGVATALRAAGGRAHPYAIDLSDSQATSAGAARILADVGVPDLLVNNAGAGRWLPIAETTPADAAQMMAVPYLAAFNVTREVLVGMRRRGSGHIVNVTSVAARLAWPGAVAYSAARAAMEGFSAALRADLYGTGIGVTLAMFGTVESPYWQHNPGSRERLPRRAAALRPLSPSEVADAIVAGAASKQRLVLKPAIFRLFFLLNALFPGPTEALMCGDA